ncbi:MAG: hypothetical protein IKW99_08175 [Bacteroidales bacterium]|nr:hypothetical protein [Bacteroidales bacterium]
MSKVAILVTIHDGDDGSAGCLEECQRQVDAVASEGKYIFSIFLNDAGEKGYQAVCEKASKEGADFFLWLDHDLVLNEGMLSCLLENSEFLRHKAVITGTVSRPDKSLLFGGRTRRGRLIEPDPTIPVPCHLFDLSIALVPVFALSHLESVSDLFRRGLLNYGYGMRLADAGVARMVAPGVLASTGRAPQIPSWMDPESSMKNKIISFFRSLVK